MTALTTLLGSCAKASDAGFCFKLRSTPCSDYSGVVPGLDHRPSLSTTLPLALARELLLPFHELENRAPRRVPSKRKRRNITWLPGEIDLDDTSHYADASSSRAIAASPFDCADSALLERKGFTASPSSERDPAEDDASLALIPCLTKSYSRQAMCNAVNHLAGQSEGSGDLKGQAECFKTTLSKSSASHSTNPTQAANEGKLVHASSVPLNPQSTVLTTIGGIHNNARGPTQYMSISAGQVEACTAERSGPPSKRCKSQFSHSNSKHAVLILPSQNIRWTADEDKALLANVEHKTKASWEYVARRVSAVTGVPRTGESVKARHRRLRRMLDAPSPIVAEGPVRARTSKTGVHGGSEASKGPWRPEEDAKLSELVTGSQSNWAQIALHLNEQSSCGIKRSSTACRHRADLLGLLVSSPNEARKPKLPTSTLVQGLPAGDVSVSRAGPGGAYGEKPNVLKCTSAGSGAKKTSHEDGRRGTGEHVAKSKDKQPVLSRKYGAGTLISQDADVENNLCGSQTRLGLEEVDVSCNAGKSPDAPTSGLQEHHRRQHLQRGHRHYRRHHHQDHHRHQDHLLHRNQQHQPRHLRPYSSAKTSTLATRQAQCPTGRDASPATLQVENGVQREGVSVDPRSEYHRYEMSGQPLRTERYSRQQLLIFDDHWAPAVVPRSTTVRALHARTAAEPQGISSNMAGRHNGADQAVGRISRSWHPKSFPRNGAHCETLRPAVRRAEPSAAGDMSILARPWWAHSY